MNEEEKIVALQELNLRIGGDITELNGLYQVENELVHKRDCLQRCLSIANDQVPTKLSTALKKAEKNSKQIEKLKEKSDKLKNKVGQFLNKTGPLRIALNDRFAAISKLEEILKYLQSFEKVEDLSTQLKQCNEDEQAVMLYGELKEMCLLYIKGHRSNYVKEYTHYWHNVLKDKFTKQYEDILKVLKWPLTSAQEKPQLPKEVMSKFLNVTRYLLLIEEPMDFAKIEEASPSYQHQENPCLPVRILIRPLKKRFAFHFTGTRQTARIDRPEWFLTQTLTWIKDHQDFMRRHVQPVADRLKMRHIRTEDEFNASLIALAAERLHTVLGLYQTQGHKGEMIDVDAAFAHAVDETLGFHKELVQVTGKDGNSVLSVLTKAETFVRWLAVEKKYALAKMDEILGNEQWMEAVIAGGGATGWVPRGADWLIALLITIEERYKVLPQPGHRLQFLELQLELIEEWRVRLTQLLTAAMGTLSEETFLTADDSPHPLTAVINAAHHTRTILLQWAHSLHYLQLHYYRRQFQHFTQQHHDDPDTEQADVTEADNLPSEAEGGKEKEIDETMSLKEVELKAQKLALSEISRRDSKFSQEFEPSTQLDISSQIASLLNLEYHHVPEGDADESGVFAEAPALLAHLRDAGLTALADHMLLEFKAGLRDYKKQKWHAMSIVEEMALTVSPSLCRPLSGIAARLHAANAKLAPALCSKLRAHVQTELDVYIFEEVVLESWWNTGGTMQLTHDVRRNLVPAFAPPNKDANSINLLPKLQEALKLLNMDYDDARRLRSSLSKQPASGSETLAGHSIRHVLPTEALQILNQRTDLSDNSPPSVLELF